MKGAGLSFIILCEGRDAAKARAAYVLSPGAFKGRIVMIMGGKNMTMTTGSSGRPPYRQLRSGERSAALIALCGNVDTRRLVLLAGLTTISTCWSSAVSACISRSSDMPRSL